MSHTNRLRGRSMVLACSTAIAFSTGVMASDGSLPLQGSCTTVVTVLTPPGVFPQDLQIDSDCIYSHLGRTTGLSSQTVTPTGQSGAVVTANIEATTDYTAANGDVLHQTFIGVATIDVQTGEVKFMGTETFQGGSGRFVNAVGSSNLDGRASIFTNTGFFSSKGELSY
jgi:hypothetical protein